MLIRRSIAAVAGSIALILGLLAPASAASGDRAWVARIPQTDLYLNASSPDRSLVFVAGHAVTDGIVAAFHAATGAPAWDVALPAMPVDALAVSPDGEMVVVTGGTLVGAGDVDWFIAAFDATTGAPLWSTTYDGTDLTDQDISGGVAISPDSATVFVTGQAADLATTVAFDAVDGDVAWDTSVEDRTWCPTSGRSIVVSPDGGTVLVCAERMTPAIAMDLIAYDAATGDVSWDEAWAGPDGNSQGRAVAVAPDGASAYLIGTVFNAAASVYDAATIRFGMATGARRWVKRFTGPDPHAYEVEIFDVSVSPDSKIVYAAGSASRGTSASGYVTSYRASSGAMQWRRFAGRTGSPGTVSLGLNGSGTKVFIAGLEEGVHGPLAHTEAFRAGDGKRSWEADYRRMYYVSDLTVAGRKVAITGNGKTVAYVN